jgi:hypothetical protein
MFITAVPITKLFAGGGGWGWGGGGGTREEPGTLTQGGALFSLVPLVWESNPKLQGGWCKTQPPAHRGISTIRGSEAMIVRRPQQAQSDRPTTGDRGSALTLVRPE